MLALCPLGFAGEEMRCGGSVRVTQLVRRRGSLVRSVPRQGHVSGQRSWPLGAPTSSSREMWSLHSVAVLDDPALPAGEDAAVW